MVSYNTWNRTKELTGECKVHEFAVIYDMHVSFYTNHALATMISLLVHVHANRIQSNDIEERCYDLLTSKTATIFFILYAYAFMRTCI